MQAERIQEFMPQLLDSLRTREIEIQAELAALPRPVESENEAAHEVSKVAKDFAAVFGQELNAPKKVTVKLAPMLGSVGQAGCSA